MHRTSAKVARLTRDAEVKSLITLLMVGLHYSQVPRLLINTRNKTEIAPKGLERHTTELIEKYSVLPGPSLSKARSEKSPKELANQKGTSGGENKCN
ncbi:hypothetical protein Tco_0839573 [Tanacetum coccineum]|uniref:Uncharacterized protein n=1 Tax=Tanacetum coccineum TaxID=301880 RepID=A0ABQ5AS54_9ASTR